MATITFAFDLRSISDRCLNLLLRGTGEGDRPKTILVRSVCELLTEEKFARRHGSPAFAGPHTLESGLSRGDEKAIGPAIGDLLIDIRVLAEAGMRAAPGSPEREDCDTAVKFLGVIVEALQGLIFAGLPS